MADRLGAAKAALRGHENCPPDCHSRIALDALARQERIVAAAVALVRVRRTRRQLVPYGSPEDVDYRKRLYAALDALAAETEKGQM